MTCENEVLESMPKAFCIALILTGNVDGAEAAVLRGIAALDSNYTCGHHLIRQTSIAAIGRHLDFLNQAEQALSILPPELCRVLLLAPKLRHCFVLRILLGMTPKLSAEILGRPVLEVDDALGAALRSLAVAGDGGSNAQPKPDEQTPRGLELVRLGKK